MHVIGDVRHRNFNRYGIFRGDNSGDGHRHSYRARAVGALLLILIQHLMLHRAIRDRNGEYRRIVTLRPICHLKWRQRNTIIRNIEL